MLTSLIHPAAPTLAAAPRHDPGSTYLPSLDGLRAVAVLTVMGSHMLWRKIPGGAGVTLFFFISGFIITRNCLAQRFTAADVLPFYVKRFFRLAPAVFVYIATAALLIGLLGGRIPWADIRATVFYYANYHPFSHVVSARNYLSPLEMTWSLAVEEHFYLFFPLALLWARRLERLAGLLLAVIVASLGWRAWLFAHGAPGWGLYAHTDTRLDSIAYGCLLSTCFAIAPASERITSLLRGAAHAGAALLGAAIIAATLCIDDAAFNAAALYSVQGLALMPVFCHLFFRPAGSSTAAHRLLGSRFMTWTGRLSYSLSSFTCSAPSSPWSSAWGGSATSSLAGPSPMLPRGRPFGSSKRRGGRWGGAPPRPSWHCGRGALREAGRRWRPHPPRTRKISRP